MSMRVGQSRRVREPPVKAGSCGGLSGHPRNISPRSVSRASADPRARTVHTERAARVTPASRMPMAARELRERPRALQPTQHAGGGIALSTSLPSGHVGVGLVRPHRLPFHVPSGYGNTTGTCPRCAQSYGGAPGGGGGATHAVCMIFTVASEASSVAVAFAVTVALAASTPRRHAGANLRILDVSCAAFGLSSRTPANSSQNCYVRRQTLSWLACQRKLS